jgi:mono/diheme cytochrome c family protein
MRKLVGVAALLLLGSAAGAALSQTAAPAAKPAPAAAAAADDVLPPGPGHDPLVRLCSSCHAPDVVSGKRLSPQDWSDLVHLMAERSGEGSDQELSEIIAYVAKNFPAEAAAK